jgi:hypothetical protein
LSINPFVPFKPYVKIQVSDTNKQRNATTKRTELIFNTFQSISLKQNQAGSIHYELIHDKSDEEGKHKEENPSEVLITANFTNHMIGLTLINLLTGDVLV